MELDYKIISFLIRGKRRKNILFSLQKPKMPKQIADECQISLSNVSVALSELLKKGLIKCINSKEKLFRFYERTKKGQTAISHLEKYNNINK